MINILSKKTPPPLFLKNYSTNSLAVFVLIPFFDKHQDRCKFFEEGPPERVRNYILTHV